jgi:hypothetical protein
LSTTFRNGDNRPVGRHAITLASGEEELAEIEAWLSIGPELEPWE